MADVTIEADVVLDTNRAFGTGPAMVWVSTTTGYKFLIDVNSDDLVYRKTTDSGQTWGSQVTVRTGTVEQCTVWFDKWTEGDSGNLIHIAYMDSGIDDILYKNLDTSGDTLGSEITVFNGATQSDLGGPRLSITKARGGNIYVVGCIDGGPEQGFWRSTDGGATFGARDASVVEGAADHHRLLPAYTADSQDIVDIFWDISASEITAKFYDDSANTWTESTAITGHTDLALLTASPQYCAAIRWSDNLAIVVAWTETDTATADLKCYTIDVSTITSTPTITTKTDIFTNTANRATCAMTINQNTGRVYVVYIGNNYPGALDKAFYAYSDDLSTWTTDQAFAESALDYRNVDADLGSNEGRWQPSFYDVDADVMYTNYVNSIAITASTTAVKDIIGGLGIIAFPR